MLNDFLAKLSSLIDEVKVDTGTAVIEVEPEEPEEPEEPSTEQDDPLVRIVLGKLHYEPVHKLLVGIQQRKNKIQQNAASVALAQAEMMVQIYGLEQDTQELIADLRLKYEVPPGIEWELHIPTEENPEAFFTKKEEVQEEN